MGAFDEGYRQAVWEVRAVAELYGWSFPGVENAGELARLCVERGQEEVEL